MAGTTGECRRRTVHSVEEAIELIKQWSIHGHEIYEEVRIEHDRDNIEEEWI